MRKFNLGKKPSPQPEGEDPETLLEEEGAGEEKPAGGGGQRTRLLLMLLAVLVVAAGGYFAYDLFIARQPPPAPARPIRPIAKAPTPPVGSPSAGTPATQPAPPAPSPPVPPSPPSGAGPAAPAKAAPPTPAAPAKAAEPSKAGPSGPVANLSPPTAPGTSTKMPTPAPAPAAPAPSQPAKTDVKGEAPASPAKKAEPSKVARAAPAAGPSSLARPAAVPGTFSLQVGAMANETNAQRLKERLEQLGYRAAIRKGSAHIRRHVVTVGDFPDRSAAEELVKRLASQGINGRVETANGRFFVEAGSFLSEDDAIDLARELQKLNYPPKIQDKAQNATLYQVRVGSFGTRAEAQAAGAELKSKGFPYLVVKN